MGVADKTLVPLRGRPLVSYAVEALAPQVGRIVLSCGRDPRPYEALGHPVVGDADPGEGPLGGIASSLASIEAGWILVHPGDTPFPDRGLVARLSPTAEEQGLAVPRTGEQRQHLVLLLSRAMADRLAAFYVAGGRAVRTWLDEQGVEGVEMDDVAPSFFNVNTASDLAACERRLGAGRAP
jgi:molybdenum cofactor guanylyltransferase